VDLNPAKAIDGIPSTRWSSEFSDPQWMYVDLGASRHISRVVLTWEAAASSDYSIEVAESALGPWQEIHRDAAGNGGEDDINNLSATGRFVRMYSRKRTGVYGNSLWEFRVYGDPSPTCSGSTPIPITELTLSGCTSSGPFQTAPSLAADKNEGSRYTNDNTLSSATLTCLLPANSNVSKIRLLMYAGTGRTYPLRVGVGSNVVFSGNTTAGAGYFEIPFSPVVGSNISISMTGPNSAGSNWFSIWEMQAFK
jgi:hypothetical protein